MTSDQLAGTVIGLIGAALVGGATTLPGMPGQQIGPSVFPAVIGSGLILCGILIALGVGQSLEDDAVTPNEDGTAAPPTKFSLPVAVMRAGLPLALLIFYVTTVKVLGFLIVAALIVAILALALGARPLPAVLLAAAASPLTHFVFGKLLRVPLAPGLLPPPW